MVGHAETRVVRQYGDTKPVWNMVPPPGVPAEIAWEYARLHHAHHVQRADGRRLRHHGPRVQPAEGGSLPEYFDVVGCAGGSQPRPLARDSWRAAVNRQKSKAAKNTTVTEAGTYDYCLADPDALVKPFLTLPTSCGEPQPSQLQRGRYVAGPDRDVEGELLEPRCRWRARRVSRVVNRSASARRSRPRPDTSKTDTPAGLTVEVKPPLGGLDTPGALASADLQNTVVGVAGGCGDQSGAGGGFAGVCGGSSRFGSGS